MTIISCNINKSGTTTPLVGYISVLANSYLTTSSTLYVPSPVIYPLVSGSVNIDLTPTDVAKVAYTFSIVETAPGLPDVTLYTFEASVPFSGTPINLTSLAPQVSTRYDRRDASLLTLARFLSTNNSFMEFLGKYLWSNKGLYNAATVYKTGDVVLRLGSSYQYVSSLQQAGITPETNPLSWTLLVTGATAPIGGQILWSTATPLPLGYLRCNGTAVSRSAYNLLFAAIGVQHGAGDGSTTFGLPTSSITGTSSFIINAGQ